MSCENFEELISPLLDRQLAGDEKNSVLAHLAVCRNCRAHLEFLQSQRNQLRAMDRAMVPAGLTARLRVAASYERERQLMRANLSLLVKNWFARMRLFADNLMRPLALPFAGGVTSTLACFTILFSLLSFPHGVGGASFFIPPDGTLVAQGPNGMFLASDLRIEPVDATTPDDADIANIVELTIDESGKVSDWEVVRGRLTPDIKNVIMLSKFKPATYFGMPTSGKVKAVQDIEAAQVVVVRSMRS